MGSCWVYSVCEWVCTCGRSGFVSGSCSISKLKCVIFFFFSLRGLLAETGSLTLMMLNEHHRGTAMHVYFSVFHVAANLRHCWMIMNGQRCVESDWVMNINAEVLLSTFQKIKKGERRREDIVLVKIIVNVVSHLMRKF